LPFRAERGGAEALLAAIDVARKLISGELDQLPSDAPIQFVPNSWRVALLDGRDRPDRRMWELALAFAVRDALRSGDLYLAESRHHVSFWNLVYGEDQWSRQGRSSGVSAAAAGAGWRALTALGTRRPAECEAANVWATSGQTSPC